MSRLGRLILTVLLVAATSACAMSLRNPHVADLQHNPGRYQHHTVSIEGVVTSSWGAPAAPYKFYRVDDGTGQVTVLSQGFRLPTSGAHVRVRGRVDELAVLGGQALGVHLREEALYVKR
ncbi:MAG TPA: OB-fold nucleic acid binding domain-containing protein [Vicinamibacterales bacterium]